MTEETRTGPYDGEVDGRTTSVVDLRTQLTRAYLSGDGAAVERVLRLLDQDSDGTSRAA